MVGSCVMAGGVFRGESKIMLGNMGSIFSVLACVSVCVMLPVLGWVMCFTTSL